MSESLNWKKIIKKLDDDTAKLLYLIYILYKNEKINSSQKKELKQLVYLEKEPIFNLLHDLLQTNDFNKFSESILLLSGKKQEPEPDEEFDLMSPVVNFNRLPK